MAINTQKLLPGYGNFGSSSKTSATVSRPKSQEDKNSEFEKNLKYIDRNLKTIDNLLSKQYKRDNNNLQNRQKELNRKRLAGVERRLEKKDQNKIAGSLGKLSTGMGIGDSISNFLGWTVLGYFVNKIFPHIPDILKFISRIEPAIKFTEAFIGNLFNGFIDFVDFGYKTYDNIKQFAKDIIPDDLEKHFKDFDKNFNTFMNLALIAGMLASGGDGPGTRNNRKNISRPSGKPGNVNSQSYFQRKPATKLIEKRYGNDAARMYEARIAQGASPNRARADVIKRFKPLTERFGPQRGLAGGTGTGKIFNRGLTRVVNRSAIKVMGKAGTQIARGLFKRIPVIGGLIDFVFSLAMGEPIGRAAAKAIGATVGGALGTFIPIPFAGTILGGIVGDIVGGALYDTIVGMSKKNKNTGRSSGGSIRRRSPTQLRNKQIPKLPSRSSITVGSSVGGVNNVTDVYSEKGTSQLLRGGKYMGDIDFVGPMFTVFAKTILGQLPNDSDYRNFGLGLNYALWKAGRNGEIPELPNLTLWISDTFRKLISPSVVRFMSEFGKGSTTLNSNSPSAGGRPSFRVVSGNTKDFWTLVAIAAREDGDPQGWADVAQSIYNRAASGAYGSTSLAELILRDGQYAPTWEYPRLNPQGKKSNQEWQAINDANTAGAATNLSVTEIEKVARALLDKELQRKAAAFIEGRTDFKAANIRFPGSIQRKPGDNNFGWQYNYRGTTVGTPTSVTVAPTAATTALARSFNLVPLSGTTGTAGGKIVEYYTGDANAPQKNYDPVSHGGLVYHEHFAFIDKVTRDSAIAWMRNRGWIIGSIDRPWQTGSYHSTEQAFDIPMYSPLGTGVQKGFEDSVSGEQQFSKAVRDDIVAGGFTGDNVGSFENGGYLTRHKISALNSMASYEEDVQILIQPIIQTKIVEKTRSVSSIPFSNFGSNTNSSYNPYRA